MKIAGAGMVCSIGLELDEVLASVDAGLSRFQTSPHIGSTGEATVVAYLEPDLLPPIPRGHRLPSTLSERQTRIYLLGLAAVQDAIADLDAPDPIPALAALPALDSDEPAWDEWFLPELERQLPIEFAQRPSHLFSHGRAGALVAAEHAARLLEAGHARVLVVAADSAMDVSVLDELDAQGRLSTHSVSGGFIAGEGAVALLFEPSTAPDDVGVLDVRSYQGAVRFPLDGPDRPEVLADAVRELMEERPPIETVFSGMNGERTWAKELGIARIRNAEAFAEEFELRHPADLWGDLGAATGAALLLLASQSAGEQPVLVTTSADSGEVSAALVGIGGSA